MNTTVLLIAAFLPLPFVIFMILRSGSFGKGSLGALLKLFFLGLAAAVPAFLMEAGILLLIDLFLNMFGSEAAGGNLALIGAILRALIAVALVEEGWKHFVLRRTTWSQMTMETIADGIAASAVVGAGFSAVMYGAWQALYVLVPADMGPCVTECLTGSEQARWDLSSLPCSTFFPTSAFPALWGPSTAWPNIRNRRSTISGRGSC